MYDCGLLLELGSSIVGETMRVFYSLFAGSSLAAIPLTMTTELLDSLSRKTVPKLTTNSPKVIVCMRDWFQSFTLLV